MNKKEIRLRFRHEVLGRDKHHCRIHNCTVKNVHLDAHHITDRHELPNGGYVKENGITLCPECHLKAEKFHRTEGKEWEQGFHPDDLYRLIGSSKELAITKSSELT